MNCRAQTRFVFHDLDLSVSMPIGFGECRRCGDVITPEQYVSWSCRGKEADTLLADRAVTVSPPSPGGLRCALCGAPVHVDPMHRAVVAWFGVTCEACFVGEGVMA